MSTQIDLTGQTDVYNQTSPITADKLASAEGRQAVNLSIERSPVALSRLFGLIGTVSMVPARSGISTGDGDVIEVELVFADTDLRKFDLLCRKLDQLTETISLRVSKGP